MSRPLHFGGALCALLALLLSAGCAGRALGKKNARDVVATITPQGLDPEDVDVEAISQTGSKEAVIEARVKAAFRVENVNGRWVVREVKVGAHPWERLDLLTRALGREKIEETHRMLERLSEAVLAYTAKNGRVPEFKNFTALADALYPDYMRDIIRLDPWGRGFSAETLDPHRLRLVSPGPDGQLHTADDIELTRSYP